jgi:hypothetical protein
MPIKVCKPMEVVEDRPYPQRISRQYRYGEIRRIRMGMDGRIWGIGDGKAFIWEWDGSSLRILSSCDVPMDPKDLLLIGDSGWILAERSLFRAEIEGNSLSISELSRTTEELVALANPALGKSDEELLILGKGHIWRMRQGMMEVLAELPGWETGKAIAVTKDGSIWVGTDRGLGRLRNGIWDWWTYAGSGLPTNDIRAIVPDNTGYLWIGTSGGPVLFNGMDSWYWFGHEVFIPYHDIRCIAPASDGSVWFGTGRGVMRLINGEWEFWSSRRWLPEDEVLDISVDGHGEAWVATSGGVAVLGYKEMTLEEKADLIEENIAKRHYRNGWVANCIFQDPGDPSSFVHEASDNDGTWTALYIASEVFRYRVMGDPAALERARNSLKALMFLEEVTPIDGFPARAAVRAGEERVLKSGGEWHKGKDGEWEWKGDTSSDEVDGHFFAYAVYYDYVEDEGDRSLIRSVVGRIMDHIIRNRFMLVDVDGERTQWGVWNPDLLNRDRYWRLERGLNSLQILSHLKTAYHITGDPKYEEIYRDLAWREGYAVNTIEQKITNPREWVYHDNELAFLAYFNLLRYEEDPALRRLYLLSLERTWRHLRNDRCPLWNFIYGVLTGKRCDAGDAVETLRSIPLDMRCWTVDNRGRLDLSPNPERLGESIEPIKPAERYVTKWDHGPYQLLGGDDGRTEDDGTFAILPYWLGRFYGIIVR